MYEKANRFKTRYFLEKNVACFFVDGVIVIAMSQTYMETVDVDAAGITVKVAPITLGSLLFCHWLLDLEGVGMRRQKSAEAITGC